METKSTDSPADVSPASVGPADTVPSAWLDEQIAGVIETINGEEMYERWRYWSGYLVALQSVRSKSRGAA